MYNSILPGKSACIFFNGEINSYDRIREIIYDKKYGVIIAVDGGANHLFELGIKPDYVVGDMDSIDENVKEAFHNIGTVFKKYPAKKNETDSQLAVLLAKELDMFSVDIYAATGGRLDHEMANLLLLEYIQKQGIYPRILTENEEIYILEDDELTLHGEKGDVVSVIPIKGNARGVTLKGFEYELDEYEMEFGTPRGISNVMSEKESHIDVHDGCLLIFKNIIQNKST